MRKVGLTKLRNYLLIDPIGRVQLDHVITVWKLFEELRADWKRT